jgi:pyruvate dehydrogenase E1 component
VTIESATAGGGVATRVRRRADGDAQAEPEAPYELIDRIADRALWLAVRMIHEANHVRPSTDGLKVGGHQASSSSAVTIFTTLYMHWLRNADLVAVKPHAGPVYHALTYLMGALDRDALPTLRSFGGLQSYPSRTKDPDRVDFSTGSVGLGAVAPMFAALADRYLQAHRLGAPVTPARRFVAVVGDAELDEGNVWEAVMEPALSGLGNVTLIVDANRQSLDRVVPGVRVPQLEAAFRAAGWQVLEAKYGHRLSACMERPGGHALRRRIDDMSNEEYQVLVRRPGPEALERCIGGAPADDRDGIANALADVPVGDVPRVLADLGGHDVRSLLSALADADADPKRSSVLFAYTMKGWRMPFAGDSLNHSAQLANEQLPLVAEALGADVDDPWAAFAPDSPEGRLCAERGRTLDLRPRHGHAARAGLATATAAAPSVDIRVAARTSTQQAFGDALAALARVPELGGRVVTSSPDVSISTNLGGWINRVGVFSSDATPVFETGPRLLTWEPKPAGQHIELGISEMNLFLWMSQFGLSAELLGEPLVPIGTVYDPFIARGLDALIYALYIGSRFILVATPSGVTLAPEGGAHQSTVTPSLGIELPNLRAWEPAFGAEVGWLLEAAIGGVLADDGFASYLRLSTRPVEQALADPVRVRLGQAEWRRQTICGGYRLLSAGDNPGLPAHAPVVNVFASGAVITEAVDAVHRLHDEEVAANLIVVTSAERLAAELHGSRLDAVRTGSRAIPPGHLASLLPPQDRRAPIVTVVDGASHSLSFLGAAFGSPVVPLGADHFGQSGTIADVYRYMEIDAGSIVEAGLLALELS